MGETAMWVFDASDAWLGGWWDACEDMESCSWELWNMGGEL